MTQRRLTAILAADVAGYSRLMGADEEGTLAALMDCRAKLIDPAIADHRGRIFKTVGDGVLAEFASVVDAVRCAVELQSGLAARNAGADKRIELRIGINLGDILVEGDDIFGDGVNVAARLQTLAPVGGICVSQIVHEQVRDRIDVRFDDLGEQTVKNIARPVRVFALRPVAAAPAAAALALPDKPSVAVLPFQNMSGDPEQEYFADGIAEDIITALSKTHWLFVIARNSSFTYKGKSVDVRQVGRELGVRYVLEGSVRRAGNRVRITAQLVEATEAHHVWAERYERALEDIFAVQDEITHSILGAMAPGILAAEIQRAQRKETAQLDQWERMMRAHWHVRRFTPEDCNEAIRLIGDILQRDPNNAMALADLAYAWHMGGSFGWTKEPFPAALDRMGDAARQAVASDDQDAAAQAMLGLYELFSGRNDDAIRRLQRAVLLDPNSTRVRGNLGVVYAFSGQCDEAIEALQAAMRLSPRDFQMVIWHTASAWSYLSADRYEEAADSARRGIDSNPAFPDAHGTLAVACAQLGRMDEARTALDGYVRLLPGLHVADQRLVRPFKQPGDRERLLAGLRKAGLPE